MNSAVYFFLALNFFLCIFALQRLFLQSLEMTAMRRELDQLSLKLKGGTKDANSSKF